MRKLLRKTETTEKMTKTENKTARVSTKTMTKTKTMTMTKTAKVLSVALLLALVVSLTACGKPDGPNTNSGSGNTQLTEATESIKAADLIGTWKGTDGEISTMTFYKDANYLDDAGVAKIEGTYSVDEALQTFTVYEKDYGMTFTYHMKMEGEKLVIQLDGGLPRKFVKA